MSLADIRWAMDRRVYIGAMGEGANKEEVTDACRRYGAVKHVWVARKPAGFAFVEFYERRGAEDAVRKLDGTWINGHKVCVEMSTGEPKFTADGRLREGTGPRRSPTRRPMISSARERPRPFTRLTPRDRGIRRPRETPCCSCHCHRTDTDLPPRNRHRYSRSSSEGRSRRNAEKFGRRGRSRSYDRSRSRSRSFDRSRSRSRSYEKHRNGSTQRQNGDNRSRSRSASTHGRERSPQNNVKSKAIHAGSGTSDNH